MQENTQDLEPISKTKLKAEADAAQAVGQKLIDLPKDKLAKLNLPEALFDAVKEAKRLTSNGAIKRQRQYIGRLMRDVDTSPIVEQLTKWEGNHAEENARFHAMERWRTRLVEEEKALSEFIDLYPQTDIQHIRTLIRNAQAEIKANKAPKHQRELFKMIRDVVERV